MLSVCVHIELKKVDPHEPCMLAPLLHRFSRARAQPLARSYNYNSPRINNPTFLHISVDVHKIKKIKRCYPEHKIIYKMVVNSECD